MSHAAADAPADAPPITGEPSLPAPETPPTPAALAAAIADAAGRRQTVLVCGRGTRLGPAAAARRIDRVLSTAALTAVTHHEPGDQTITVQAGVALSALDAHLERHGQCLPVALGGGTVGGLIATAADGATDLLHGRVRERVLGATVALADGSLARGRGRVVKNVAGYDLPRLLVGSLGTLGAIVEVSLKLEPRPAARNALLATFAAPADAFAAARALLTSDLQPACVDVLLPGGGTAREGAAVQVIAGFEGGAERVRGASDAAAALLAARSPLDCRHLDAAEEATVRADLDAPASRCAVARAACDTAEAPDAPRVVLRCSCLPADCESLAARLVSAFDGAPITATFDARPGLGLLFAALSAPAPAARSLVERATLGALAAVRSLGHAVILAAPDASAELRTSAAVWGPPPSDFVLMQRLKAALDPDGVFAAGRFVGGL